MIHDSGQSLLQLINDILDFSKIESGKITLHNEWFDFRERVGDCLRSLTHKAHAKGIELICNIDPRIPVQILGDVQRLRQVLLNLVGNSIKFTEQGEVQFDTILNKQEDETIVLRFEIRDSGIGIPDDKLATIFDEFVQVDSSSTRNYGGTGLGLAITSQLVTLMGGELNVSSQIGRGSQFFFELEFVAGSNPVLPIIPDELRQKAVILVVDHDGVRSSFENALKSLDLTVYSFDETESAIKLLSGLEFGKQSISAILTEASRVSDGQCDDATLADQDIRLPPVVAIAKTQSDQTESSEDAMVRRRIFHPVKHSELTRTLQHCFLPIDDVDTEVAIAQQGGDTRYRILVAEDNPVNSKTCAWNFKEIPTRHRRR